MTKPGVIAVLALLGASAPAFAQATLAGKFAFSTKAKPDKTHCAKIGAELAAKLKPPRFTCETTPVSSGGSAISCTGAGDGAAGYLVFGSLKACEEERKTQSVAE